MLARTTSEEDPGTASKATMSSTVWGPEGFRGFRVHEGLRVSGSGL